MITVSTIWSLSAIYSNNWGEPERDPHDEVYEDFFCLSVRSHSVYTRVLIQRQRMRKASVQYIDLLCLCVRVATCVYSCRVLVLEFEECEVHGVLAFDNKNNQSHHRSL